ncbi:MAG TPA: potassium-transporting ATPase subunit KdpC [Candidatus Dormibacteraeota bacterium]|nr:potassium-transporting ATPase subunit KdpC [Candidatus Dormibacteraeota bacterium]
MLASLPSELLRALRLTLVIFAVTGLIYPFVGTGLAQALFHGQANGSLVTKNGQVVGSTLIGQEFTSDRYFHARPSATVNASTGKPQPYAADNSAGSNYGASNAALIDRVKKDVQTVRQQNGLAPDAQVPADLVTTDFSGFDPDISEASALLQVDRVAKARGLDAARVRALVESHVQGRVLWIFGEPYVNVLDVNMALDGGEAG